MNDKKREIKFIILSQKIMNKAALQAVKKVPPLDEWQTTYLLFNCFYSFGNTVFHD